MALKPITKLAEDFLRLAQEAERAAEGHAQSGDAEKAAVSRGASSAYHHAASRVGALARVL